MKFRTAVYGAIASSVAAHSSEVEAMEVDVSPTASADVPPTMSPYVSPRLRAARHNAFMPDLDLDGQNFYSVDGVMAYNPLS